MRCNLQPRRHRARRFGPAGCLACLCLLLSNASASGDRLVIATWGGPYEAAQTRALFAPFTRTSGVTVDTSPYTGGLDLDAITPKPSLIDMTQSDALLACDKGLLHTLTELGLDADFPVPGGGLIATLSGLLEDRHQSDAGGAAVTDNPTSAMADATGDRQALIRHAIQPCSIAHSTYATLVAYNDAAFPGVKPDTIEDFFDLERFPGKRGLERNPDAVLEWALMAEGIPISQVHDLLSTNRGLDLAFRKLDSIREHILWWDTPQESVNLLASGAVSMGSGYNGRFFSAQLENIPLVLIWDGQLIDYSAWAVPVTAEDHETALAIAFIRFAMAPARQAAVAEAIPYGPTQLEALTRIGVHDASGIPMLSQLPTAPHHMRRALLRNSVWYANTEKLRRERFDQWLAATESSISR